MANINGKIAGINAKITEEAEILDGQVTREKLAEDVQKKIFEPDVVTSKGADLAEVGFWVDDNPNNEDRLYRFVSIAGETGREIKIADADDQIAGTSNLFNNVGFIGNYTEGDENDNTKVIVSIIGVVPVRTNDDTIVAGDRVMSDDNGYAVKSSNNLGYRVLEVMENGLLSVVVSPNTDMVQRIKTDMESVKKNIIGSKEIVCIKDKWETDITNYRQLWLPFEANKEFTLNGLSFECKFNNGNTDGKGYVYAEIMAENGVDVLGTSERIHLNNWVDRNTLIKLNFDFNLHLSQGKYYVHLKAPYRQFSKSNIFKSYSDEFITILTNAKGSDYGDRPIDLAVDENFAALGAKFNISYTIDLFRIQEDIDNAEKEIDDLKELIGSDIVYNEIYVSKSGNDTTGDGTVDNPYATVLHANEIITDNSYKNRYVIKIADGTYTDMQELYAGDTTEGYKGIMGKSYVTYESISNNPNACIMEWNGSVGFDVIDNDLISRRCFFHINSDTLETKVKGIKFVGQNLRYCFHFESNARSTPTIENCIFDWYGNDIDTYQDTNGYYARPTIGMGGSLYSKVTFKECEFYNHKILNNGNHAELAVQWHDNKKTSAEEGSQAVVLRFEDCFFDDLSIMPRSTQPNRPMNNALELVRCRNIKNIIKDKSAEAERYYWEVFNQASEIQNNEFKDYATKDEVDTAISNAIGGLDELINGGVAE